MSKIRNTARERVRCDICGFRLHLPIALKGVLYCDASVAICLRCKHIYANPRPSDSAVYSYRREEFWPEKLYKNPDRRGKSWELAMERWEAKPSIQKRFSALAQDLDQELCLKEKRVLEIGCGTGILLDKLRLFGADPVGIEPWRQKPLTAPKRIHKLTLWSSSSSTLRCGTCGA